MVPSTVSRRAFTRNGTRLASWCIAASIGASVIVTTDNVHAQDTYPSPYMGAKSTPLFEIDSGAKVAQPTVDYWSLPSDSPMRTSYDEDVVVEVADGVWTFGTHSIVNSHAVLGPEGLIVYDTGDNLDDGNKFYTMLRSVSDAPIRAIIYSHEHYVNGAKVFIDREAERGNTDIKIIAHSNLNDAFAKTGGVAAAHPEVSSVLYARTVQQFNLYLPKDGPDSGYKNTIIPGAGGFVPANTTVTHGQTMKVAGLDVVFYTEDIGTDTTNQVLVWIPGKKLVMNNVLWGWFPNIYSARGGRYRDPNGWIYALDFIRNLKPDILLSTHSTSLSGADKIETRLQNYRDGLAYVLDQTLKGILLGLSPDELRYSVKLPERLEKAPILVQNYGEISTMPPRIYTAIFGQFDNNRVETLNKLHPAEEAARMIDAMGGEVATQQKAQQAYQDGDYLWSAQIAGYLVANNNTGTNRQIKADALRQMAYRTTSTNSRSWYLSDALALEGKVAIISAVPADAASVKSNLGDYVNYYRVRINPERSATTNQLLTLDFGKGQHFGLRIRESLVDFISEPAKEQANSDLAISLSPEDWTVIYNNLASVDDLIEQGAIKITKGSRADIVAWFGQFDPVYDWQNDPALRALKAQMTAQ
ncbi:alkyl sulfatase dimerization domain-containing protein [Thalassospira sp. SM2505]